MKNAKLQPLKVVVLDEPGITRETRDLGAVGFRVKGRQLVLLWSDEGKTWKMAEACK